MTEEEILERINIYIENTKKQNLTHASIYKATVGLLDLYKQAKQENEELKKVKIIKVYLKGVNDNEIIWQDKINNEIKELKETMKTICEKEDVDDYQCEEYYKIMALENLLKENNNGM